MLKLKNNRPPDSTAFLKKIKNESNSSCVTNVRLTSQARLPSALKDLADGYVFKGVLAKAPNHLQR